MPYAVTNAHYIKEKLLQSGKFEEISFLYRQYRDSLFEYRVSESTAYITMFFFECHHKLSNVAAFSFLNIASFELDSVREVSSVPRKSLILNNKVQIERKK